MTQHPTSSSNNRGLAEGARLSRDLPHHTGTAPNGARKPPIRVASSGVHTSARSAAEAALEAWLASEDLPEAWQLGGLDAPPTSLTVILGELVLSPRRLSNDATSALGLPFGTTLSDVAVELLLAVNDPTGPRCASYRSALDYLCRQQASQGQFG